MDLNFVPKLENELLQGIRRSFIAEPIEWEGLIGQNSNLTVGQDTIWLSLQDIKSNKPVRRHRIILRSKQVTRQKAFMETRSGWFSVERAVEDAVWRLQLERAHREERSSEQRLFLEAKNDARRLRGAFSLSKSPRQDKELAVRIKGSRMSDGTLHLEFDGLPAADAQELLTVARQLKLLPTSKRPKAGKRTMWDHLADD